MPEGGVGIPQFSWEELFDGAGWFLTGYGDNVSLGATGLFRHSTGLGNAVPYHHPGYIAGSLAATAVYLPSAVLGTVQLAKMGYKVGASFWASAQAWRAGRTVQLAAQSLPKAAKLADDCDVAYHYTTREGAESIVQSGYKARNDGPAILYVTTDSSKSGFQAVMDLALRPNLPYGAVLEVDLAGLRATGYSISDPRIVSPANNQPGGGVEILVEFLKEIPKEFFRRLR